MPTVVRRRATTPAPACRAPAGKEGHFPHRHIRRDNPAGAELLALEVPECRCAYEPPRFGPAPPSGEDWADRPRGRRSTSWEAMHCLLVAVHGQDEVPDSEPCRHTEEAPAAADDRLMKWWPTLEEWAEMLLDYDPYGHGEPALDPAGPDVLVEPDVRVDRYYLRAKMGWAIRHPLDVLTGERFGVRGRAGRHDVRAQGGGLCGQGVGEEEGGAEAKARRDVALWDEVRAELAVREVRRAERRACA